MKYQLLLEVCMLQERSSILRIIFHSKQIETMEQLDQFLITSLIGGGTGGLDALLGLSSLFPQGIWTQSKIKWIYNFPISVILNNVVGVYNSGYSIAIFENSPINNVIDDQLELDFVDYRHLNNFVAQAINSYTRLRRFNSCDNSKFISHVFPYPRIHFLLPSYDEMTLIMITLEQNYSKHNSFNIQLKKSNFSINVLLILVIDLQPYYLDKNN
ncbi:unnamed protein product [Paramecium octaurelia]|uniref:Uncharacterized protein n=1 Tax=Paramecium octaurelia TaxID=43137 RepID=A0A8S1X6R5_PAROT|nr:unnamed protein product [Paramecium octaurelia]